jgi:hypothetical protein
VRRSLDGCSTSWSETEPLPLDSHHLHITGYRAVAETSKRDDGRT